MALLAGLRNCLPWLRLQLDRGSRAGIQPDTVEASVRFRAVDDNQVCERQADYSEDTRVRVVSACSPHQPEENVDNTLRETLEAVSATPTSEVKPCSSSPVDEQCVPYTEPTADCVQAEMRRQELELAALLSKFDDLPELDLQSKAPPTKMVVQEREPLRSSMRSRTCGFRVSIGDTSTSAYVDARFAHRLKMTRAQLEQAAVAAEIRRQERELNNILREEGLLEAIPRSKKRCELQMDRPKKPIKHVAAWLDVRLQELDPCDDDLDWALLDALESAALNAAS
eukprot:TRINITY_DN4820_c0_g1_i8.p1 TRINITY_DN4820_c0_g1~~TRINITY_DN4820_c0_g1_i8.p1  ORF type:complete len:298 (-),score=51.09 TRINITY_DN4820_c0_g1_i8:69-917(-)